MSSSTPFVSSVTKLIKLTLCLQWFLDFFFNFWINLFFCKTLALVRGVSDMIPMPLDVFLPLLFGSSAEASPSRQLKNWCPLLLIYLPSWVTPGVCLARGSVKFISGALLICGWSFSWGNKWRKGAELAASLGWWWCHPALGQPCPGLPTVLQLHFGSPCLPPCSGSRLSLNLKHWIMHIQGVCEASSCKANKIFSIWCHIDQMEMYNNCNKTLGIAQFKWFWESRWIPTVISRFFWKHGECSLKCEKYCAKANISNEISKNIIQKMSSILHHG